MAKPNTLDLAARVKARTIGLKDIPADLRPDVERHLTRDESKLIQHIRRQRAEAMGDRCSTRVHQRFVAG